MAERVRIPLRQHHHRTFPPRRNQSRIDKIIFRMWRVHRGRKPQEWPLLSADFFFQPEIGNIAGTEYLDGACFKPKIRRDPIREELIARRQRARVVVAKITFALRWSPGWLRT